MSEQQADCASVVQELYTFLDGELTEAKRVEITRHLHGCINCHEVVEFHAELKMMVAAKCRDPLPDALRDRVLKALGTPPRTEYRDAPGGSTKP